MEYIFEDLYGVALLCGCIFMIAGVVTYLFPPKKINPLYGYRTSSSMRSQERWEFAQRFSTIRMIIASLALILISFAGLIFPLPETLILPVNLTLVILAVAYIFIATENALRKRFT